MLVMLYKLLIGLFVFTILSALQVTAHPVYSDEKNRVVVRVTARAAPAPVCSSVCSTARTVVVSGTATFTASPTAVTVFIGSINNATSVSSTASGALPTGIPAPPPIDPNGGVMDFGLCSTPEIEFGAGFDGSKATTFQPVNQTSYNQTASPDISVIAEFICGALDTSCGANVAARTRCAQAQAGADAAPPQEGIDADIFNGYFGIVTNFTDVPPLDYEGNVITNETGANTASYTTTSSSIVPTVASQSAPAPSTSTRATSSAQISSSVARKTTTAILSTITSSPGVGNSKNLQVFTGSLGGITAPAVTASGKQFQVEGDSLFNAKVDALQRSCDNQQNACADAANRSKNQGDLTVDACSTQLDKCNAANGS